MTLKTLLRIKQSFGEDNDIIIDMDNLHGQIPQKQMFKDKKCNDMVVLITYFILLDLNMLYEI